MQKLFGDSEYVSYKNQSKEKHEWLEKKNNVRFLQCFINESLPQCLND